MKKFLKIICVLSFLLNLVLGFRFASRYYDKHEYAEHKVIDKSQTLAAAYPRFTNSLSVGQRSKNNYIFFTDTSKFYKAIGKLYYLDSLATFNENTNFIVATDGNNDFVRDYLKKYNLHFDHLIFMSRLNYLQSAISNERQLSYKVMNGDLVLDKNGKILYFPRMNQQGNRKILEEFFVTLKNNQWQQLKN